MLNMEAMVSSNLKRKLPNIIKPRNQNRILLFYKKHLLFLKIIERRNLHQNITKPKTFKNKKEYE